VRLQEELENIKREKEDLEAALNEVNEENKAIKAKLESYEQSIVPDLQGKIDRAAEVNARKVNDLVRLRQYFERLRSDFFMLNTSRKNGKPSEDTNPEELMMLEASNDSDRMVTDQISNAMEIISKIIDANVQNEPGED